MKNNNEDLEKEAQQLMESDTPQSALDRLLTTIPVDTPLGCLSAKLKPLWRVLGGEDEITAGLFIEKSLKEYFGLKKSDLGPFHRAYKKARRELEIEHRNNETKEERTILLDRDINSPEVFDAISTIGIIDKNVLDLVIASFISAKLRTVPPIWLMLVGVPSSFKTELVRLIDLPEIYSLDTLSENAFSSGYVMPDGSEPKDLLPQLDGKCFVIKDLTTLFSLKEDTIKKILGDLTSIFDGRFEKFTATRGDIRYDSQFSMVTCVTPAILSKHYRYMHQLGGRFFFIRIPELTSELLERGHAIAWASDREKRIKNVRQIVSTYCHRLSEKATALYPKIQTETPAIHEWINTAANLIACARGTTETKPISFENDQGEKVDYYEVKDPQIEQPWRILGQLRSLARVLAAMRGKMEVTSEELESLKAITISSMPIDRAVVIGELLKEDKLLPREVGERINKSSKTASRDLKELTALGLVLVEEINDSKTGRDAKGYSLKPEFKRFLTEIKAPQPPL
jgi:hypothetical protein